MGTVGPMRCLTRLLRSLLPFDEEQGAVLLRHARSGTVLTSGPAPIRFPSAAEASAFSARFLDEPAGWEVVPAAQSESKAA